MNATRRPVVSWALSVMVIALYTQILMPGAGGLEVAEDDGSAVPLHTCSGRSDGNDAAGEHEHRALRAPLWTCDLNGRSERRFVDADAPTHQRVDLLIERQRQHLNHATTT